MSKAAVPLESAVQASMRKAVGLLPWTRLFRNNRGVGWQGPLIDKSGRTVTISPAQPVEYGLTDGASDLIGLTQVTITPEMVGRTLAVFTAAEVKRPNNSKVPEHQQHFVDFVNGFGGIAGVVRTDAELVALLSRDRRR